MKFLKITALILSLTILTACKSGQPVQTSETVSVTSAVTTTATTTATETEPVPETEPAEIAKETEYVQVSADNQFIDFEFIENYQGTTDIGDLADKAVEFLKTTDEYAESMKNISEFSDEEFSDYIVNGVIVPKFGIAYPNDYDGDGREETFIILKMPSIAHEKSIVRDFIIFADSGENMEIIDHTLHIDLVSLLNYGRDKQIIFGGHGDFGAEEFTGLYGVKHGDVVTHYSGRVSFYKSNCFLSAFGWQGGGDFMYYDTSMQEYRPIMGEVLTIDEMKAIDKESFFAEYYEAAENDGFAAFLLIGGKYYCLIQYPVMDVGTIYTCEDGKFALLENSHVRVSLNEKNLPMVKDIDINKAIAEMKSPAEPFVSVSADNQFIDFEFIENYQGTADIGDLADKAVEFLKTTDEYAESMKNISEFSDEEFSDYIADGVIFPKFRTAYPNDYDGDGRTETFIAVDMPVHYDSNILTSFYIYADSGEKMTLLDVSGRPDENAVFLNYGKDKQIAFGGGMSPYGSISYLYGVKYGDPVLLYSEQAGLEKRACFLRSHGFQATESFMYYDTAAREYRQIAAVQISLEELKALDTSGSLNSVFEENGDQFSAWVVGGKYYCIKVMFEFADVYTYDSGTFTLMTDPPVGLNLPQSLTSCGVKDIDIDKAIAEMKPPAEPFVKVSENNEFIDYEFIEYYQGTTDIGDLADKAVDFLKTTDFYADSMKNIAEFSDEEFSNYIADGVIVPKFSIAYPNDYDGDGRTETFIMVDMPYFWGEFRPVTRNILIFADSYGKMEVIGDYSYFKPERYLVLLNYGKQKQIIFGGDGTCGADMHTILYGVKDGKAVEHFGVRGSYEKDNCFLKVNGYQGDNSFLYFDTAENEYREIVGVPVSIDEMKAIDSESFFAKYYSLFEEEGFVYFELVSKNYYRVYRDLWTPATVYKYENGKFTKIQNSGISNAVRNVSAKAVIDIDIDKAIAEMKPPAEPFVKVSENNEFIDYEFIEDYQGTTDIGDLADKAADFLKTTEVYSQITKYTDEISESELADYIDENGEIKPRFGTAFPLDYDGDGSTETFIVVYMPTLWGQAALLRSYIVFCGSNGKFQLLDDFGDSIETAALLDYGKYKHLIFGSYGFCGADSHDTVFGVRNGKGVVHDSGRVSYVKENCFLSSFGWQGSGNFMYFDTGANEYRLIQGKEVSEDELKKMDKDGILDYYWENYLGFYINPKIELIGGKYYCFNYGFMTPGDIYTYENGKFVEQKQSGVRNSNYRYGRTVVDIDIEKAVAEMKKPQK